MSSFYGNTTSDANITYDYIYPNRVAMENDSNNTKVLIGRHVLIEYSYGIKPENAPNGWPNNVSWSDATVYDYNSWIDSKQYSDWEYDSTIWKKIIGNNGKAQFVQIGELSDIGFRTVTYNGAAQGVEIRGTGESDSVLVFDTVDGNIGYQIDGRKLILSINKIDGGIG